ARDGIGEPHFEIVRTRPIDQRGERLLAVHRSFRAARAVDVNLDVRPYVVGRDRGHSDGGRTAGVHFAPRGEANVIATTETAPSVLAVRGHVAGLLRLALDFLAQ